MATMASAPAATLLSLLLIFLLNSPTNADVTDVNPCYFVSAPLAPCIGVAYDPNDSDLLSSVCCEGASLLATLAGSTPGSIAVCQCLQNVLSKTPLITPLAIRNVIGSCNVALTIPNLDTDCFALKN